MQFTQPKFHLTHPSFPCLLSKFYHLQAKVGSLSTKYLIHYKTCSFMSFSLHSSQNSIYIYSKKQQFLKQPGENMFHWSEADCKMCEFDNSCNGNNCGCWRRIRWINQIGVVADNELFKVRPQVFLVRLLSTRTLKLRYQKGKCSP